MDLEGDVDRARRERISAADRRASEAAARVARAREEMARIGLEVRDIAKKTDTECLALARYEEGSWRKPSRYVLDSWRAWRVYRSMYVDSDGNFGYATNWISLIRIDPDEPIHEHRSTRLPSASVRKERKRKNEAIDEITPIMEREHISKLCTFRLTPARVVNGQEILPDSDENPPNPEVFFWWADRLMCYDSYPGIYADELQLKWHSFNYVLTQHLAACNKIV